MIIDKVFDMQATDLIGLLASALVLLTFTMKAMAPLRIVALCSNCAFLIYGLELQLVPVFVLHMALLPINGWRLWQVLRSAEQPRDHAHGEEDRVAQVPHIRILRMIDPGAKGGTSHSRNRVPIDRAKATMHASGPLGIVARCNH